MFKKMTKQELEQEARELMYASFAKFAEDYELDALGLITKADEARREAYLLAALANNRYDTARRLRY
jgi:hypothetical protein